jgi:DNA-binding transcriptional ArsR family regulator
MAYTPRTWVPNALFDHHLSNLGYAELKVLLVIIRQTYGWRDKHSKGHKQRDWISIKYFVQKTGLSARAISTAIASLSDKNLIIIRNEQGKIVRERKKRQFASKLYFETTLENGAKDSVSELRSTKAVNKLHTTIITHTKVYNEDTSLKMKRLRFQFRFPNNKDGQ